MDLNWMDPGPEERAVTAEFVQSDEASELRPVCTAPAIYDADTGQFVSTQSMALSRVHVSLATLEATLPAVLGPRMPLVRTCKAWDDLTESLLAAEKDYDDHGKDRWHRIWYGLGDKADVAMPWTEIIPNDYGLAIVKTGVAAILRLARKSLEKRRKILQAFEEIQKAMTSANPLKGSFRSHADVAIALDELHQTIVDSVNDMLVLTAKEEHSWRDVKRKLIQRTKYRDIELVLQLLSEKTQGLKDALENAHYQSIEAIDIKTTYIAVGTGSVARGVRHLDEKVDLQTEEIRSVSVAAQEQNDMLKGQDDKMNRLLALLEALASNKDTVAETNSRRAEEAPPEDLGAWFLNKITDALVAQKKDTEIQKHTSREEGSNPRRRRGAVVNYLQFSEAIADRPSYEDEEPDIEAFAAQPDSDWGTVSRYRGDFDSKTRGQVQSILQQRRFLGWMRSRHPDMVLVLADLPNSTMEKITAVSVFCATLITSLTSLRRGDLVLHFFCGLHVDPRGPSPGPRGLVRSLIMQLFAHLTRAGGANLDFICDRDYVRDIEDQKLAVLCQTLRELLWQCEPGVHVYCIIDSITLFEGSAWSRDLTAVVRCLRDCVEDGEMPAVLKVMLTSSALCAPELKALLTGGDRYPGRVLYLSAEGSFVEDADGEDETGRRLAQMSVSPRQGYGRRYEDEC